MGTNKCLGKTMRHAVGHSSRQTRSRLITASCSCSLSGFSSSGFSGRACDFRKKRKDIAVGLSDVKMDEVDGKRGKKISGQKKTIYVCVCPAVRFWKKARAPKRTNC